MCTGASAVKNSRNPQGTVLIFPNTIPSLHQNNGEGQIWVRPASMWDEIVIQDGKELKRRGGSRDPRYAPGIKRSLMGKEKEKGFYRRSLTISADTDTLRRRSIMKCRVATHNVCHMGMNPIDRSELFSGNTYRDLITDGIR